MGKRWRKRRGGRAVEARDEPTPETLRKLVKPAWDGWASELGRAASEIDVSVRLIAGSQMVKSQDLGRICRAAAPEWTAAQLRVVRHYRAWVRAMARLGWAIQEVLAVVVHGAAAGNAAAVWRLRCALHLHATGKVLPGAPVRRTIPFHNKDYAECVAANKQYQRLSG